ncbi:MarR family transcriptional regulator [Litoribacillus peritrichatus]|uniref:MarR family transcriptional regulator n=1 Tax=Litoribacillus peritrichatus TaxID=718191 RepID=A0ABP7N858_9GAMM
MAKYPEQLKLDNQMCFLLYSASRSMTRLYRPLLDELNLTYPQYLVMMVLWESGEKAKLSVGDICEKLMLDTGTVTPLLKRLAAEGYLTRIRDPEDERRVVIRLTDEGCRLRGRAEAVPLQLMCNLGVSDSDTENRDQLMGLLKELVCRLNQ